MKIRKLTFFIILFLLLANLGCQKNADNSINAPTKLNYDIVTAGQNSGLTIKEDYIIKNNQEWEAVWQKIVANQLEPSAAPAVDFNQETVIVIALGEKKTGGYSVKINNITETENQINIAYSINAPGSNPTLQAFTQPYIAIKITASDKTITFN